MESSRSMSPKPDWAWLPENVLYVILTELFLLSDLVSFGSVCRNWRSASRHRFQELSILPNMFFSRRLPMLLIPSIDSPESRNLYSLPDGQVYDLRLQVPYNTRYIGSSHGWLIFIETVSFVVTLFNPFYFGNRKGAIYLPPFLPARDFSQSERVYDVFPEYFITKAVLSTDPVSSPNYTVILIYGRFRAMAYYKSGDESWTCISGNPLFSDVIYSNGHFTAVNLRGELYTLNPEANLPQLEYVSGPLYGRFTNSIRRYIVNDRNSLFQVVRTIEFYPISDGDVCYRTRGFFVYMLGLVHEMLDWVELSNIGDSALFVGDSYSCCVRASAFPGIIPNSIYFTDDFNSVYREPYQFRGPIDAGIYLIGDGSFHTHYNPDDNQRHLAPPIWIIPTI